MKYYTSKLITIVLILQFIATFAISNEPSIKTPFGYTISKETTYFTEPIAADGSWDYIAALNKIGSRGITQENNLALDIIEAVGLEQFCQQDKNTVEACRQYFKPKELPNEKLFQLFQLISPDSKTEDTGGDSQNTTHNWSSYPEELTYTPWQAAQHPQVHNWLQKNKTAMDKIVLASKSKDRFFVPLYIDDTGIPSYEYYSSIRHLVRSLCIRSMLYYGSGQSQQATEDIIAIIRLSRAGSGETMFQELVSQACEAVAFRSIFNAIAGNHIDIDDLQKLQHEINSLPKRANFAEVINNGERCYMLGILTEIARGNQQLNKIFTSNATEQEKEILNKIPLEKIDWDVVLRKNTTDINELYNLLQSTDIFTNPEHFEAIVNAPLKSEELYQKQWEELSANNNQKFNQLLQSDTSESKQILSELYYHVLGAIGDEYQIAYIIPYIRATVAKLNHIAVAIAIYQAKQGKLPATLAALKSYGLTQADLIDPFSETPFIYKINDDASGYILYSIGLNHIDDGGLDDTRNGDIVISVGCGSEVESLGK